MEEIKRKRGRPRKDSTPEIPQEIQTLIEDVQEKAKQIKQPKKEVSENIIISDSTFNWDVKKEDPIEYFDATLSYELTGYRPITATQSLDFNPDWFTETREIYNRTGHYCEFPYGSQAFREFWREELKRCKYGMTSHGYTITGDHYFFLNFYRLKDLVNVKEAGGGREDIFPAFLEGQYEWFHYLKLARILKLNACMMKARGAGYSEIEASILVNSYNCIRGSVNVACAFAATQLDKLLTKVYDCMTFLNEKTDRGMFKSRTIDKQYLKRSGQFKMVNGQKIEVGWKSQIQGIVTDEPGKLRGDRTDLLMFEECGLWPKFTKAYTQADALVGQIGYQWGLRLMGGTGGETGEQVKGLKKMFYNPKMFGVLPFKHNYTQSGEYIITSFFLPAFRTIKENYLLDNRGWISDEEGKRYYDIARKSKESDPEEYYTYCAEYCNNDTEAFQNVGVNKFNKLKLAEQQVTIRIKKEVPPIQRGYMEFIYSGPDRKRENIIGARFRPNPQGPIHLLEEPIWENGKDVEKIRNLYIAGIDGIDIGALETSDQTKDPSKFCTVVKKRVYGMNEPMYVAYYLDRPNDIRDAYKQTIGLLMWYNCQANIEATRLSLLTYARDNKFMQYFMKRPRVCYGDNLSRRTNNQYGTTATKAMIDHQTDLIATYIEDYCHNIWFLEFLEQLSQYTDEGKGAYDIVAALGMCEVADEELAGITPRITKPISEEFQDIGYYKDENGNTQFGIIPKQLTYQIKASIDTGYVEGYNITSDSRYR